MDPSPAAPPNSVHSTRDPRTAAPTPPASPETRYTDVHVSRITLIPPMTPEPAPPSVCFSAPHSADESTHSRTSQPGPARRTSAGKRNTADDTTCHVCGLTFARSYNLKAHLPTHDPQRTKLTCDYCPVTFYRSGDLRRHRRTHVLGRKPELCEYCGKDFTRRDHIQRHIERRKCPVLFPPTSDGRLSPESSHEHSEREDFDVPVVSVTLLRETDTETPAPPNSTSTHFQPLLAPLTHHESGHRRSPSADLDCLARVAEVMSAMERRPSGAPTPEPWMVPAISPEPLSLSLTAAQNVGHRGDDHNVRERKVVPMQGVAFEAFKYQVEAVQTQPLRAQYSQPLHSERVILPIHSSALIYQSMPPPFAPHSTFQHPRHVHQHQQQYITAHAPALTLPMATVPQFQPGPRGVTLPGVDYDRAHHHYDQAELHNQHQHHKVWIPAVHHFNLNVHQHAVHMPYQPHLHHQHQSHLDSHRQNPHPAPATHQPFPYQLAPGPLNRNQMDRGRDAGTRRDDGWVWHAPNAQFVRSDKDGVEVGTGKE